MTHLHYDHCGNHELFPKARYHLQDSEIAYATGRYMRHAHMRIPFEADDVVAMVRKVFADRVVFHDGDDQIAPGITVHRIGGHSKGLQCVRVKTQRGHVVLASDASHLYPHITEGRVFPITYCVGDVLEGYSTIKRLADSPDHIVPGHDPMVAQIYPAAAPGLEGLIVRLDVAPKSIVGQVGLVGRWAGWRPGYLTDPLHQPACPTRLPCFQAFWSICAKTSRAVRNASTPAGTPQ